MIPRTLTTWLKKNATWFPIVSLTGPRQSGKSTLLKGTFPDYDYVNLEDPSVRRSAIDDPRGFIRNRSHPLVVDEAQYVPDLFSMIQVVSDEMNKPGQYILSGSQNFLLLKQIHQSLAGRVGITKLLPLTFQESQAATKAPSVDEFMLQGGFPRLYDVNIPTTPYFSNYITTYVTRDVTDYLDVRNISSFNTFLRLCADNTSQLVNFTKLAQRAEVSTPTIKSWLSILESSYVVFQLMPYSANLGKRLTRAPKLYFYDTGLLCHLLGITNVQQLLLHPMLGAIFENLIVAETVKTYTNNGEQPELYFYRDDSKIEVDLLDYTNHDSPQLIEIKSGETYHPRFAHHLTTVGEILGVPNEQQCVVYRGTESFTSHGIKVKPAQEYLT